MEPSTLYEKFGGLLKEEPLSCLEDNLLLENTCVLEAVAPFFGYYNDVPGSVGPKYLYFVLEESCPLEKVLRATLNIRKKHGIVFDGAAGSVTIYGQHFPVIRVRDLEQFSHIGVLQRYYLEEGLVFRKKLRKFTKENALINLMKFFYIEPVGEMMYIDRSQPHHGYFTIPRHVPWNEFKELTREVKYDTNLLYFDAASAYICENKGITEMVRIYRENLTVDKLSEIRKRYLKLLKADYSAGPGTRF